MVYLDYNGSTPVDPQVADLVVEASAKFANPSSVQYKAGQDAAEAIEEARQRVASFVCRGARDVVFTSGASEAATIAIVGAVLGAGDRVNVVASPTEHKAILAACETAARLSGGEVRYTRVNCSGVVDVDYLQSQIDETVALVVAMAANNETGVLNPVEEIGSMTHAAGARYFCDAVQLAGKADIAPASSAADLMVISSHKIYGPKGAGAMIADRYIQKDLVPIFAGGGQERGLRGGTQNTPAIAGFGLAAELAGKERPADEARLHDMAANLLQNLGNQLDGVSLNGVRAPRLGNTLNLRFADADSDAVMASLPTVAISSGSACQSAVPTQSHVLRAMGLGDTEAAESVRISLGRPTTLKDMNQVLDEIVMAVRRVRELSA